MKHETLQALGLGAAFFGMVCLPVLAFPLPLLAIAGGLLLSML